ncbi:MAG TPA: VWA domain-containing protein [Candidatus Angelobacter sp.]|nr:VWA domain-containing protein [Candidatus Angelobacter sp.]
MSRLMRGCSWLVCAFIVCTLPSLAQQNLPDGPAPKRQPQQNVPDAPQPKNPNGFPDNAPPAPKNNHEEPSPAPTPAAAENPAPNDLPSKREDLYQMHINVNFVQVPVTVKNSAGKLVPGLTSNDFKVYEDGQLQQLKYFTADAFPLSAAIVVATDLPSSTMKKVNESLPALIGAFSQYDEVALYRYGHTVSQISAYTGAASLPTSVLNRVKRSGREGGPPIVGGPFGGGPTINGHSVNDPNAGGQGDVQTPPREFYVLNDAILLAAEGLSRRDKTRRRIIFVISDGREQGSNANYNEVKKILLSNNISVFAIGVDTAAIPIYDKLNRIRVPGFGTGNILARYANDTGGNVLAEFDRQGIEQAYAQITETARNQYTLGYTTRATQAGNYRTIDVRVLRPNLNVIAKPGYYPLPPQQQNR